MDIYSTEQIIRLVSTSLMSYMSFALLLIDVVLVLACLLGRKVELRKRAFVVVLLGLVVYILVSVAIYVVADQQAKRLYMSQKELDIFIWLAEYSGLLFTGALTLVFSLTIYKEKKFCRTVETFLCAFLLAQYWSEIMIYVYSYFTGTDIETASADMAFGLSIESLVYQLANLIISVALFIALYYGMYKKGRILKVNMKYVAILIVWELVLYIVPQLPFLSAFDSKEAQHSAVSAILGVFILLLGVVIPVALTTMIARRYIVEKNIQQEKYMDAQLEYIRQYKISQNETRAFRHDIINNLQLMDMLMNEGKTAEAKEHLETMLGEVKALSPKNITGDEMLDCIVSMKAEKMQELGIKYHSDGVLDGGLQMKPTDICSVFANAFDNAIEACARLPKSAPKSIDFSIKRTNKFYNLRLSNSSINEADAETLFDNESHYTSKEDENIHGFGTKNMKHALEKYGGMLKAETERGRFVLTIVIPRES
ncbi:MAG: sensor histidine kinase [Eubacterium sp.]|nr:sensor histidine kinase [Eubacterium sp.]